MNRDRQRLTPIATFTGGQAAGGVVVMGRHYPMRGGIALPKAGGSGGTTIKRFRIETVSDDYLVCKAVEADGTVPAGAALWYIAKPAELRGSTYSGVTVGGWSYALDSGAATRTGTYTLADGQFVQGMTTVEKCEPSYTALYTHIYASQVTPNTGVPDPQNASQKLTWLDLNVDARKWLPPRRMVTACLNGVPTPIVIRSG